MTDLSTLTLPEMVAASGKLMALTRAADAACDAAGAPLSDAQYAALGELLAPFAIGLAVTERKLAARDEELAQTRQQLADAQRLLTTTHGTIALLSGRLAYHEREAQPRARAEIEALRAQATELDETLGAVSRYLYGIVGGNAETPILAAGQVAQEIQRGRALVREVERLRAIEAAAQALVDRSRAGLYINPALEQLEVALAQPRQATYDPNAGYPPIPEEIIDARD